MTQAHIKRNVLVRYVNLFELGFGLDGLDPLLLDVAVGCLPHVVVLDYILERLPGQEIVANVVEVFAVLVEGLLKEVRLRGAPLLHFVPTQHGT